MFMRTKQLFLRPIWREDQQDLTCGCGEGLVSGYFNPGPHNSKLPHLAVTCPQSGTNAIGAVGLADEYGLPLLGCWIAPAYRGNGYATEAAIGLISLARVLGHSRIVAHRFTDNPASTEVFVLDLCGGCGCANLAVSEAGGRAWGARPDVPPAAQGLSGTGV